MDARSRFARAAAPRRDGRHLLRSATLADELIRDAGIGPDDHVVEIGAGDGRLTAGLARLAGRVTAVELDPVSVRALERRFLDEPRVTVVGGDALTVGLPGTPYRAFGNIPFGITNPLLRRLLDDPSAPIRGAELIIQFEAAAKRTATWPSTALGLGWQPWWTFSIERRISRAAFTPPPTVDAALLRVARRATPLLEPEARPAYVRLVRAGFRHPTWPIERVFRGVLSEAAWRRFARSRGIDARATPRDLGVHDWVALFRLLGPLSPPRRAPRRTRPRTGGTTPTRS